jgi:hypothetical protein
MGAGQSFNHISYSASAHSLHKHLADCIVQFGLASLVVLKELRPKAFAGPRQADLQSFQKSSPDPAHNAHCADPVFQAFFGKVQLE